LKHTQQQRAPPPTHLLQNPPSVSFTTFQFRKVVKKKWRRDSDSAEEDRLIRLLTVS
jgi:hypothetical protein